MKIGIVAICAAVVICSAGCARAAMTEYECTHAIGNTALYGPNVLETDRYRMIADCAEAGGNRALADELRHNAAWREKQWAEEDVRQKKRDAEFAAYMRRSQAQQAEMRTLRAKVCNGGALRIGNSEIEAIHAWCYPDHRNTTETAHGTREQWVYPDRGYLYFEDGRLVAIQRRN